MEDPTDLVQTLRTLSTDIYGIDWDLDDFGNTTATRERYKPFCEYPNCGQRVSTEFGRPKPYCKDHVEENPYVKDLLSRIAEVNDKEDRKKAEEAFLKLKKEFDDDR